MTGGETRQETVAAALRSLEAAPEDIVLVHDAVRPLIGAAIIDRTIDAISKHGAAIVGLPAIDTIKQVDRTADGAIITATVPRERIVLAQTPQGARFASLMRAFDEAEADGFAGTDEASLLERSGYLGCGGSRLAREPEDHATRRSGVGGVLSEGPRVGASLFAFGTRLTSSPDLSFRPEQDGSIVLRSGETCCSCEPRHLGKAGFLHPLRSPVEMTSQW